MFESSLKIYPKRFKFNASGVWTFWLPLVYTQVLCPQIIGPQFFDLVSVLVFAPIVSQNTDRIMQWPWLVLNLNKVFFKMLTRKQAAFLSLKKRRDEKCHENVYNSLKRKYICFKYWVSFWEIGRSNIWMQRR